MNRTTHWRPGFVAALLHRLSGIALAIFLPLHFLSLGIALRGADAFDRFLAVTANPFVKFAELGLVMTLALHMALGLRVLAIEFLGLRERTTIALALCVGVSLAAGILFLVPIGPP